MKIRKFALILHFIVILSGCAIKDSKSKDDQMQFYYLQRETEYSTENGVISSESRQAGSYKDSFILSMYLQGPTEQNLVSPFPKGVSLISVSQNGTMLELTLSSEFTSLQGYSLTLAYACIAHTAASVFGSESVHIFAEGEDTVIDTIIDKSMFLLTDDSGIAADSTERQGN